MCAYVLMLYVVCVYVCVCDVCMRVRVQLRGVNQAAHAQGESVYICVCDACMCV